MEGKPEATIKYMVCHDGSQSSADAYQFVKFGLLRNTDELVVAHVWSRAKEEYLDFKMKRDYIHNTVEAECSGMGKRFVFHDEEMLPNKPVTAKSMLNDIAETEKASICVVGFHGRKGPKADPTVMGSAVQYLSTESKTPVLIMKDPKTREQRPDGYRLAACVDGSRKSLLALSMICDIRQPNDKICVITCAQKNIDVALVKEKVEKLLTERGCFEHAEINVLESEFGVKTAEIIKRFLISQTEKYIDIVLVGNQGADFSHSDHSRYLGSVADAIIRHTKLNALFIP
eukprot:CAMPEP_0170491374 /NCGR_PEP_ID=MMETSP0208-20121228/10906_1 /TAXON_ID=197538 /ORGANISM="Strombidium inclinatum, Strain S3" /LENGTH=286 /DNA_ID=CAMNT_0010766939 /DNA_START=21 /DNA_END=881 /DNA_ORIENTATION=+